LELTDQNFDSILEENGSLVVDFWAPWCMPCQMIAPTIEELAKEYKGKVVFGKLNVDKNPKSAARYQVMGIPMLLIFKDGEAVDSIVGALPKEHIKGKIDVHAYSSPTIQRQI